MSQLEPHPFEPVVDAPSVPWISQKQTAAQRDIKAFISSTFIDLKDYRKSVIEDVRRCSFTAIAMEDWTASPDEPKEFSRDRMLDCDLCILLVAHRRGFIPDGESRSITQMEYEFACERKIDVLVFLLDDQAEWRHQFYDEGSGCGQWRELLRKKHGCEHFVNDPLLISVAPALTNWLLQHPERLLQHGIRAVRECLNGRTLDEGFSQIFKTFKQISSQIRVIGDYKSMHDSLHQLQNTCYGPINATLANHRENDPIVTLADAEVKLESLIKEIDQFMKNSTFRDERLAWPAMLEEALSHVVTAIDENNVNELELAAKQLALVLTRQPPLIDIRLNERVRSLDLSPLVDEMNKIKEEFDAQDPRSASNQAAAQDLQKLQEVLRLKAIVHSRWQSIDQELRQIEIFSKRGALDIDSLTSTWPMLERAIGGLFENLPLDECEQIRRSWNEMSAALAADDRAALRRYFLRFRALINDEFYRVDLSLLETCSHLQVVGNELDKLVN